MANTALAPERQDQSSRPFTHRVTLPDAEPDEPRGDDVSDATPESREPISVLRSALVMVGVLCLTFVGYITIGTSLQHHAAQTARYNRLRSQLAQGTAPVGPTDEKGNLLAVGTPIAVLKIPAIGVHEVVGEGTTGTALQLGPGHLRSTVFPGGAGTSVVLGRSHTYGGPFGDIAGLKQGATVEVTTANGTQKFKVVKVRRSGEPTPGLASGSARISLVTATGSAYLPSETVTVDADATKPLPSTSPPSRSVSASERPLGTSTDGLFMLFLWLEALVALAAFGVWTWYRRSPAHALLLFTAPVLLAATMVCRGLTPLLPNLM